MVVSEGQRAAFLVVLLDARSLVIDVQRGNNAVGYDAGAKRPGGTSGYPAIEDRLNLFGTAGIEIFANHVLEKDPSADWPVKYLSKRKLDLQDGELIAVAGLPVFGRERMGQQAQPFAQQGIDLFPGKPAADRLQPRRIGAGEHAVVQCLIFDSLVLQLALGVFVPIQAKLGVVWEVRAELQKEGTEVSIQAVKITAVR